LGESRLPDAKPAVLEDLCAVPEHIQPFPLVTGFNPVGLGQDRNRSLSRLVELTDQMPGPLILRVRFRVQGHVSYHTETQKDYTDFRSLLQEE